MKILIRIMGISLLCGTLTVVSCGTENSRNERVFSDLLSLDEKDSTEYFELRLPGSVSVSKVENFETTTYLFSDSIQENFMSLRIGFYWENLALFDLKEKNITKMDSFYYFGSKNKFFFVGDSLKKKKLILFQIIPSFECRKENQNCTPWPFVFQYDSTKVDEELCKKIMSSLKYFKKK